MRYFGKHTWYLGYRFRSRLEAQWAAVFHVMGISFLYEPELVFIDRFMQRLFPSPHAAWVAPNCKIYLPDFYLCDDFFWVEVKPENFGSKKLMVMTEMYHVPGTVTHGNPSSHFMKYGYSQKIINQKILELGWEGNFSDVCAIAKEQELLFSDTGDLEHKKVDDASKYFKDAKPTKCYLCNKELYDDHDYPYAVFLRPLCRGGKDNEENAALICKECFQEKRSMVPNELNVWRDIKRHCVQMSSLTLEEQISYGW
jgi:hypothetical protein